MYKTYLYGYQTSTFYKLHTLHTLQVFAAHKLGDNLYGHYRSTLYSTTVTYLASKATVFGEKRKIRTGTPLKVIQGHRGWYQSRARMRPLISD